MQVTLIVKRITYRHRQLKRDWSRASRFNSWCNSLNSICIMHVIAIEIML